MAAAALGGPGRWALLILLLIAAAIAFRTPLQLGGRAYNPDELQYAAMAAFQAESTVSWGETIAAGPNRPLHMALYSLCDALFGHYPFLALDIAHSIVIAATAGLLALIAAQLLGLGWAARALIGAVFVLHSYPFAEGWTNNSEHMANLLKAAFLACWLWGNSRASPVGRAASFLLLGLAVSTKMQQVPLVLCAPVFWYLAAEGRRTFRAFVLEMLGAALFFLLPFLAFALLLLPAEGGGTSLGLKVAYFFSKTAGYRVLLGRFTGYFLQDPIALIALAASAGALFHGLVTWSFPAGRSGRLRPLYLASALFAFEVLSTVPGLRFHSHYFLLIAPGALLVSAAAVTLLLRSLPLRRGALVFGFLILLGLQASHIAPPFTEDRVTPEAVALIRQHSGPEDRIFVWGWNPGIYAFADRLPASRFVICSYLVNDVQTARDLPAFNPEALATLLRDLEAHPPALFVLVKTISTTANDARYEIDRVPPLRDYLARSFPGPPLEDNERFTVLKRAED